jgi:hypothetical protein
MSNDSSSSAHGQIPSSNGRLLGNARGELERQILDGVKGTERLILHELFGFFWGKAVCWPGNAAIAKEAGVSVPTVCRSLKALEDAEVIKTVDDSSTRSRRRIILLAHPCSGDELARLEASPHTRFDRCRIGRPTSDNSNGTLSNRHPDPDQNDKAEVIKLITETVKPLSAELESPNSRAGTGGENSLPNGERESKPPKAVVNLTDHQLATKARAEKGDDPVAKAEWETMRRALLLTAPAEQIIAEALEGGPASPLEFLQRLKPGAPDSVCNQAVEVLCKTLGATDARDYRRAYQKAVNQVRKGVLSPQVVIHAFEQASHPSARNPGRVFGYNVENRKGLPC